MKRPRIVLSDAAVADILEQSDLVPRAVRRQVGEAMGECGNVSYRRRRISCILPVRGFLTPAQMKENR